MVRYTRTLTNAFAALLAPIGAFHRLLRVHELVPGADPWAIDVQTREGDALSYYHGTTKLLDVRLSPDSLALQCTAAPAYHKVSGYSALHRPWKVTQGEELFAALGIYLNAAITAADARYYRNGAEGAWQNALCLRYGRGWLNTDDWLIVDREAVLGYSSAAVKGDAESLIAAKYQLVRHTLQHQDAALWGQPNVSGFGNEVDFLVLGPEQKLFVVELKHGSNASGIYWASLQAAAYRDCWQSALPQISAGVAALVRQKIELGFLPASAASRLPTNGFQELAAAVWIADPNVRSTCWKLAAKVQSHCPEAKIPFYDVTSISSPVITPHELLVESI